MTSTAPQLLPYLERLLDGETVEWKTLGEMAEIGTGSSNRQDEEENGLYPFYVRSKNILRSSTYQFDETAIIIPREGGIGDIFHYAEGKYALHQRAYRIKVNAENELFPKFLFYYMTNTFKPFILSRCVGATATSIRKPMLADFSIPIPPLRVQARIVEILDKFTQLEAELEARNKQYDFYRNRLLDFAHRDDLAGQVEWKTLGEICEKVCSGGTPLTSHSKYYEGNIPWLRTQDINWQEIHDTEIKITEEAIANSSAKLIPENCVIVAMYGATAAKACINKIPLTTNQACCNLQIDEKQAHYKYAYYWICNEYERLRSQGEGSQSNLNAKKIKSYPIPLPPLSEQRRIVGILDRFDTLTNSISEGLPREIALRRKQYEYYRDALLRFPPPAPTA